MTSHQRMNRSFSTLSVCLFMLVLTSIGSAQSPPRNVLFVGFDDLRIELRCYGRQYMHTPNIDALARRGLLFEQAYCQQAICAASRSSLLTGMRPDSTGIYDLNHPLRATLPDVMSMPRFFKEHGYRTISLGKIYHHPKDDQEYWDVLEGCNGPTYAAAETVALVKEKQEAAARKGLKNKELRTASKGVAMEAGDVEDSFYGDGKVADEAIQQLRSAGDKPFFMAVGFRKPHLPFVAPKKYWDMYDPAAIQIPSRKSPLRAPAEAFTEWGELRSYHGIPAKGDLTDEQTRTLIHAYRACVSYVDAQLGRILEELDKQGLRENTLIVLWGDHGWKLGEYGDWCKHTNFELDTHVPLIFSGAGVTKNDRCKAVVEYIDMFPTIAQWCGFAAPHSCEGRSLMPLLDDPRQPWSETAISQYPRSGGMGYSVRSGGWRYTEWRSKTGEVVSRELYDHSQSDVAEVNVVDEPQHAATVKHLHDFLARSRPKNSENSSRKNSGE
jgi:iduronate 2-sulfatase